MKTINCEAELLPDGHLVLPPEVMKQMKVRSHKNKNTKKRIIIFTDEARPHRLSRFCGKWQGDSDADDIIAEIRSDREKNARSDEIDL